MVKLESHKNSSNEREREEMHLTNLNCSANRELHMESSDQTNTTVMLYSTISLNRLMNLQRKINCDFYRSNSVTTVRWLRILNSFVSENFCMKSRKHVFIFSRFFRRNLCMSNTSLVNWRTKNRTNMLEPIVRHKLATVHDSITNVAIEKNSTATE